MKNATRKRQFRRQIRELDNHQSSRSRIDQDEFEIRRQFRIIKFKALESKIRIENSNFEKSNLTINFEKSNRARHRKFRRQIRHEKSRNLHSKLESKFESKIEIREVESTIEIREIELSNETKISTTNSNRNSRSRIEQAIENFDDKFESKIEIREVE